MDPNLEYLFLFLFFFPPSPNLFQQLYQILTDFDIRFYMYELLKVSDIVSDSLDVEPRSERGSGRPHGAALLAVASLPFVQNPCLITQENLGRDLDAWLVAVGCYSQTGPLVTSKEPLTLWSLLLAREAFVVVRSQAGLCLLSPCL